MNSIEDINEPNMDTEKVPPVGADRIESQSLETEDSLEITMEFDPSLIFLFLDEDEGLLALPITEDESDESEELNAEHFDKSKVIGYDKSEIFSLREYRFNITISYVDLTRAQVIVVLLNNYIILKNDNYNKIIK